MHATRRCQMLAALAAVILAGCSAAPTHSQGQGGGQNSEGSLGVGEAHVAGTWQGRMTITVRCAPPSTDFPGQTGSQDVPRSLAGDLTLVLEQSGSDVRVSGDGGAQGTGCTLSGDVTGAGAVTSDGRGVRFDSMSLLGCSLAPFVATLFHGALIADVTGTVGAPGDCVLESGYFEVHRTGG